MKKTHSLLLYLFHYAYWLSAVGAIFYVVLGSTALMGILLAGRGADLPLLAVAGLVIICVLPFAVVMVFLMLAALLLMGKLLGWFSYKVCRSELSKMTPFGPFLLIPLGMVMAFALGSDSDGFRGFLNMVSAMKVFAVSYGVIVLTMLVIGKNADKSGKKHNQSHSNSQAAV